MPEKIPCPFCHEARMLRVDGYDGLYECPDCGERTHQKVEKHRSELEGLTRTDLPISDVCETLLGDR